MWIAIEGAAMEAVRGYLRELREGQKVSQDELADAIGLSRKALIDWEMGRTEDIKTGVALKALQYLHGAAGDLMALVGQSLERGIELARERLAEPAYQLTADQERRVEEIAAAIPEESIDEALDLLAELQRQNQTTEWFSFGSYLRDRRRRGAGR